MVHLKLRQDCEFEASLDYLLSHVYKQANKQKYVEYLEAEPILTLWGSRLALVTAIVA